MKYRLEAAVEEHGSIQAAMLAGFRALARRSSTEREVISAESAPAPPTSEPAANEEISAREAAAILGLKTSTVRGYIR
jgi:DNA-directed RNA polymerase specialized sigma24 family protein